MFFKFTLEGKIYRRENQTVNMPAQYFDVREDEQLSIEIRKYACLLDKSNAGYKAKDRIENAWKEIDNSLGIEESITLFYDYFNFYFMIMTMDTTDIFQFPKFY